MRIRELASGLAGLIAALDITGTAATAHACTCDPSPIYSNFTEPKDGARNVPLNFAPVLLGSFVPGSETVEDGLGQPVDVAVNEGPARSKAPSERPFPR